jgi:4-hydroxy-tetrahydrodipicolinate reductase
MTFKVSVIGATGRMGKLAVELIQASQEFDLHAALDSKSELKQALGADVWLDITRLEVSQGIVDFAIANNQKVVVGTSGWSAAKLAELEKKLELTSAAVVVVPNFSIGSMLATKFAAEAGKYFENIEIVEAHHAGKVDSPSGTAVRTAELIAANRGSLPLVPGVGQTARGEVVAGIPIHSLRLNGISAKQDVILGGKAEVLTISHEVSNIDSYAAGILASLKFAAASKGLTVGLQAVVEAK